MDGARTGPLYEARKALFARGIRLGRLTLREIEDALPPGSLSDSERWLLYYSLKAAQVEIVEESQHLSGPQPEAHNS